MRADFRHQKNPVAMALESLAHPIFALSTVVFPTVVEKCDPIVDCLVNDPDGSLFVFRVSQMVAAEPQRRHLRIVLAEFPKWD